MFAHFSWSRCSYRAGVSAELHVYAGGEHGFGVRKSDRAVSSWPERCADWLRDQGVMKPNVRL